MKNIPRSVLLLLIISFVIRFSLGMLTGAADDDAGDYVTFAIQAAHTNNLLNFLDYSLGRQVFQLWIFCLVCFMKLFGATNSTAILLTSIIGTLNILILFKLISFFYPTRSSFYISAVYSVVPIIVYTSYNPCYETIFIFLFLFSVFYYFRFINTDNNKYLIISGIAGSLLAFIHAYGYPVILVIFLSFPFIYSRKQYLIKWILFSFFLLVLPVIQIVAWKVIYGSYFPYLELLTHWAPVNQAVSFSNIIRFLFYLLFSLSFILLPGITLYMLDLKGTLNRIGGLVLVILVIALFFIFRFQKQTDLFKYFFLIFSILFLILKRPLIKENGLIYLFGVLGLVFFTLMIFMFPARGNPRMFAFLITVLIPVTWYYSEKIIKNNRAVFIVFLVILGTLLISGLLMNFTSLKNKEIGLVKGKFSTVFRYNIPISVQNEADRKIVKWLKKNGVTPNDYIIASINSNRYVPSNLDMSQDHFFNAFFFSYSHKSGFTKQSLENYLKWINENNPRFIIWDIDFQDELYAQVINKESGERKIAFDFDDFNSVISQKYEIADTVTKRIIVYKLIK